MPDDGGDVTRRTMAAMSPAGRRWRCHSAGRDGGDATRRTTVAMFAGRWRRSPPDDGGDVTPRRTVTAIYHFRLTAAMSSRPACRKYRADIGVYFGNQWMARNLQMQTSTTGRAASTVPPTAACLDAFLYGKAKSQAVNGNVDIDSDHRSSSSAATS